MADIWVGNTQTGNIGHVNTWQSRNKVVKLLHHVPCGSHYEDGSTGMAFWILQHSGHNTQQQLRLARSGYTVNDTDCASQRLQDFPLVGREFQGQGTFCVSNSLLSLTHGAQSHLQRPRYSLLISRVRTSYLQKASQGNVPQGR